MYSRPQSLLARWGARKLIVLALALLPAGRAHAAAKVVDTPDFSMELGMRLQPRMEYEAQGGATGDRQRDFLVRRARLKAAGRIQGATYGFEWKIDGTDRIGTGPSPGAAVENAWIQFPLGGGVDLKAGLYDAPFSRDRLTSDSRQLAVDRGEVSNVPDALGLVDNVTGFEFLGKLNSGREMLAVGLFDNRTITGSRQDTPMIAGRLDLNLGSSKDLYQDAHFGTDKWYSIGLNGSIQNSIENAVGAKDSSNAALGIDGMVDVPVATGRVLVRGELNAIRQDPHGGGDSNDTTVLMLGAGWLVLDQRLQPFLRFDEVRRDPQVGGAKSDITFVGANYYRSGHSLKLQGDVRFQSGTHEAVDGVRFQAQVDF